VSLECSVGFDVGGRLFTAAAVAHNRRTGPADGILGHVRGYAEEQRTVTHRTRTGRRLDRARARDRQTTGESIRRSTGSGIKPIYNVAMRRRDGDGGTLTGVHSVLGTATVVIRRGGRRSMARHGDVVNAQSTERKTLRLQQ
jgi:hypothetical protein